MTVLVPDLSAGRSRPLRGLRRSRQERDSKDSAKLLLLYDENLLENDPYRESKDMAFAQSYLNRVSCQKVNSAFSAYTQISHNIMTTGW